MSAAVVTATINQLDKMLECLSKPILRPVGDALIEETLLVQVAQEVSG
jgi:hypothetical protein